MSFPIDTDTISHGIQLAVAPVFLLTAVSGMIATVAGRLARIIDRARVVEARLHGADAIVAAAIWHELGELRTRGHLANLAIALLTLCAFLIGATIVVLFLGETTDLQMRKMAVFSFLAGVVCFMLALSCFMVETFIATRLLNFGKSHAPR
jgi:hypothetical protein